MTKSPEWRPVVGWEGYYEVSDVGGVRSLPRGVVATWGTTDRLSTRRYPGKEMRPQRNTTGHLLVELTRGGRAVGRFVHRLMLEAFVGPCPDGHIACHRDGDPGNNVLTNLYWATYTQNRLDTVRHGVDHMARRDRCKHGHEYTPENTAYRASGVGGRRCRQCERIRATNQRAQKRAAAA